MRDQLETALAFEGRVARGAAADGDAQRRESAHGGSPPEYAAGAQLDGRAVDAAIGTRYPDDARVVLSVVSPIA
jgi:hypothetical protein